MRKRKAEKNSTAVRKERRAGRWGRAIAVLTLIVAAGALYEARRINRPSIALEQAGLAPWASYYMDQQVHRLRMQAYIPVRIKNNGGQPITFEGVFRPRKIAPVALKVGAQVTDAEERGYEVFLSNRPPSELVTLHEPPTERFEFNPKPGVFLGRDPHFQAWEKLATVNRKIDPGQEELVTVGVLADCYSWTEWVCDSIPGEPITLVGYTPVADDVLVALDLRFSDGRRNELREAIKVPSAGIPGMRKDVYWPTDTSTVVAPTTENPESNHVRTDNKNGPSAENQGSTSDTEEVPPPTSSTQGILDPQPYDVGPVLIKGDRPVYPEDVRAEGAEGTVILWLIVGPDGTVRHAEVYQAEDDRLAPAALNAGLTFLFKPAEYQGKPVTCQVMVPVSFASRKE